MAAQRQIKRDLEHLQADLGNLMKHVEQASGKKLGELSLAANERAEAAEDRIRSLIGEIEELVAKSRVAFKDAGQKVETTVQEHPMMSLLGALGVGVILGKFLDLARR